MQLQPRRAFPVLIIFGILIGQLLHLPDVRAGRNRRSQAGGLPAANARIDRVEKELSLISEDILALQESVLILADAVDTLEDSVSDLSQTVDDNSDGIAALDERVTTIEEFLAGQGDGESGPMEP